MSYRDPGSVIAAPVPPPTQPLQRRPLRFYFAIAVGAVLLLLLCLFGVYIASMKAAISQPLDKTAVVKAMQGIPVFEGAKLDELQTKIQMRVVLPNIKGTYPSGSASVIAYRTYSNPDFVVAWYDKEMQDRTYTIHNETDDATAPASLFQHQYRRGDELILVQAQRAPNKDDTSLVLMRFTGYKGKE